MSAERVGVIEPDTDQRMVVDTHNCAHILVAKPDRRLDNLTLCGGRYHDLWSMADVLDILEAPWSLLTNTQYRAWPPWPCQTCLGRAARVSEETHGR